MAATYQWHVSTGAGPTTDDTQVSTLYLGSTDEPTFAAVSYPIVQPAAGIWYSYEKWVRGYWAGSFSQIDNLQSWMSASGGGYEAGVLLNWRGSGVPTANYSTPTFTVSPQATVLIPTQDPGAENVTIGGSALGGSLSSTGHSDYMVFQYRITNTTPPGAMNARTITLQYDEV